MKIAYLLGSFPALSETFVLNQITGMIDRGHDVSVFANSPRQEDTKVHEDYYEYNLKEKTNYYYMPLNKIERVLKALMIILINLFKHPIQVIKTLNFFKYRKRALNLSILYSANIIWSNKNNDFDIIHCHFGSNGAVGLALKEIGLLKGKLIVTFHGSDVTSDYKNYNGQYDCIFKKADLITTNSNFLREKVINLGCSTGKIKRLPVGIDTTTFKNRKNDYENNNFKILSVARLVEYKGLQYSIKAINLLSKKIQDDVRYYIVGDGLYKEKLQRLVSELKLNETVFFEGWKSRNEIFEYYNKSDIFILPSIKFKDGREEAQGLVLQEAQSMALPVITTDVGGIPEGVLDNQTGFVIEDKREDLIAEKIEMLYNNYDIRKKFGENGRKYIIDNFSIKEINDKLEHIYWEIQ